MMQGTHGPISNGQRNPPFMGTRVITLKPFEIFDYLFFLLKALVEENLKCSTNLRPVAARSCGASIRTFLYQSLPQKCGPDLESVNAMKS